MSGDASGSPTRPWGAHEQSGTAEYLHGLDLLAAPSRSWWRLTVTAPAVVLGSAQQSMSPVDGQTVEVTRRRSGGGAVYLSPDTSLWIDVVVPRDDPLWEEDVSRSALWLGAVWVEALGACGVDGEVYRASADRDPLAKAACFVGRAPGEVVVGGSKLVGISQRRTRSGARFQSVLYTAAPDAEAVATALGSHAPAGLLTALASRVGVVPVSARSLVEAFRAAIVKA